MNHEPAFIDPPPGEPVGAARDLTMAELVADVYEHAPLADRRRLVEHLLQPLSILSIVAVADGVFARFRLRGGWQPLSVRLEDLAQIRATEVSALAEYAQQVSVETVDGLSRLIAASPVMSGSAAAALLVSMLVRRVRSRAVRDGSVGPSPATGG